jgi:hypothetical protein
MEVKGKLRGRRSRYEVGEVIVIEKDRSFSGNREFVNGVQGGRKC